MTIFNPDNKEKLTFGELLDPAMNITEQEDADQYFQAYSKWLKEAWEREGKTAKEAPEEIAKANLGYWAGYYSNETRIRVEKLFKCAHPVFGSIEEKGVPTAKQAFELGMKMGEEAAKRR